jgi:uncharacterized protein YkwD
MIPLIRFATLLLLGAGPSPAVSDAPLAPAGARAVAAVAPTTIAELTNMERQKAGVGPLVVSPRLMQAAQLQADEMVLRGRLDHVLSDGRYPQPKDRLAAVGYRWRAYAENLARGQQDAEQAVAAWVDSAGHRTNLLNRAYTEQGAGCAVDMSGRAYYVSVFGKPE